MFDVYVLELDEELYTVWHHVFIYQYIALALALFTYIRQ